MLFRGERLRRLSAEVAAVTREAEILSMKMRVHDDIGRSVIATRRLLQQGLPTRELDLTAWKNAIHQYSIKSLKGYIDGCSGYDELKKEELTIGGYYALKATYLDEWGDAAESVYIEFGNDANTYLAILINVSAYTKQQRDSAEVQNIINSIQVN